MHIIHHLPTNNKQQTNTGIGPRTVPNHHVRNVHRRFTSDAPSHLENAMNETMELSFETDDLRFSLDLQLNTKMYSKFTKIYSLDDNGEPYLRPRRYRSYVGTGIIFDRAAATEETEESDCSVTFYKDSRFHCVCVTEDDVFTVDMSELSRHHKGPTYDRDGGERLFLTRASEIEEENGERRRLFGNLFSQKMRQFAGKNNYKDGEKYSHGRSLLDQSALIAFDNCFTGQTDYTHQMNIGVITDTSYNSVFGNDDDDIEASIESIFNDATGTNMVYYYQLNVWLAIGTVFIGNSYSGYSYSPATYSSGYSINSRLDELTNWRKEYLQKNPSDTNGLWHLLTNHHAPPGTVGLAYVGVLCSTQSSTGVSNYISYSPGTWYVIFWVFFSCFFLQEAKH